jgi:hypothetical protein
MKLPAICAAIAMALYVSALIAPFDPAGRRPGIGLSGPVAGDQQIHWQGRKQIFLETRPWYLIPHSVTTVAWVRDGSIFVPCGSCSGKRWPRNVAARPDVRLKIDGAIHTDQRSGRAPLGTQHAGHGGTAGGPCRVPDGAHFNEMTS